MTVIVAATQYRRVQEELARFAAEAAERAAEATDLDRGRREEAESRGRSNRPDRGGREKGADDVASQGSADV